MTNNQLVPVFAGTISNQTVQLCNARELHEAMQVKRDFTNWFKGRVEQYGFIDGEDFIKVYAKTGENLGGRPSSDFHITLDMGKELAMVERNEFGKAARRYFIALERQAKQSAPPLQSTTITKEQIGIIYQTLCAKYPNGDNRHAAWSRFNKYFNLNEYKSLPASRYDEAIKWLGGVQDKAPPTLPAPTEPDESRPLPINALLPNGRYFVSTTDNGTLTASPLQHAEFIASWAKLPKLLNESFGVTDHDLILLKSACVKLLSQRVQLKEQQLDEMKRLTA